MFKQQYLQIDFFGLVMGEISCETGVNMNIEGYLDITEDRIGLEVYVDSEYHQL